ncbi:hypothetical protein Kim5_CH03566 [Rhizobium sp. Kim5]|nr:hypothetical protein Kim5_CH03566 [Rhizobium sp. Kim5]
MSDVSPGAPSSDPSGHLLPAGEKGAANVASSPFSQSRRLPARRKHDGSTPNRMAQCQWLLVLRFWNQEISRERRSGLETILAALQGRLEFSPELPGFYSPAAFTNKDRQRS